MALKFNPATGRYERFTEEEGYTPIGPMGQMVPVPSGGSQIIPYTPVPTTTVPKGRSTPPAAVGPAGKIPSTISPTTTAPAKPSPTTTAPRATTTTVGPTTTTTAPRPTTTAPRGAGATPTTTVPTKAVTGAPSGYKGVSQTKSTRAAAGAKTEAENQQTIVDALNELFKGNLSVSDLTSLLGEGGGGSASAAAAGRAGYISGMRAAAAQEAAALQGQQLYNQLGESMFAQQQQEIADRYNPQLEAIKNYFTQAGTTAGQQITGATQQALAGLVAPSAYADLTAPNIQAPTQALDLAAYGVSPEAAKAQAATDAATAKFMSDLVTRGYQQTQAVNKDYMDSLRNAVTAGGAEAQRALAANLAGIQAQEIAGVRQGMATEQSQASAARDAMIKAGLESLISGKQTAAGTRAQTEAEFGAYKPKKASKPKRPKRPV